MKSTKHAQIARLNSALTDLGAGAHVGMQVTVCAGDLHAVLTMLREVSQIPGRVLGTYDAIEVPYLHRNDCNQHSDCAKADAVSQDFEGKDATHCRIEDCEDCFGC